MEALAAGVNASARVALASVCCASPAAGAQTYAPGEAVVIAGAQVGDWGRVEKVEGRFGKPSNVGTSAPAVTARIHSLSQPASCPRLRPPEHRWWRRSERPDEASLPPDDG